MRNVGSSTLDCLDEERVAVRVRLALLQQDGADPQVIADARVEIARLTKLIEIERARR